MGCWLDGGERSEPSFYSPCFVLKIGIWQVMIHFPGASCCIHHEGAPLNALQPCLCSDQGERYPQIADTPRLFRLHWLKPLIPNYAANRMTAGVKHTGHNPTEKVMARKKHVRVPIGILHERSLLHVRKLASTHISVSHTHLYNSKNHIMHLHPCIFMSIHSH